MNPQKNQAPETASLLNEIQTEVSAESAPLLGFILRYSNIIVGLVFGLLLLVAAAGVWQWRGKAKNAEVMDELARITFLEQGDDRIKALSALAHSAPDGVRLAVCLTLAQSAMESGEYATAATAYADAAKLDSEGPFGAVALISQAGALLRTGQNAEAVTLLQEAEKRLPEQARTPQLRQMTAEAAVSAGQKELALNIYKELANATPGRDGGYFRSRVAILEKQMTDNAE